MIDDAAEQAAALINFATGEDRTSAEMRAVSVEDRAAAMGRANAIVQALPDDELLWFMSKAYEVFHLAGGEHAEYAAKMKRLGLLRFHLN